MRAPHAHDFDSNSHRLQCTCLHLGGQPARCPTVDVLLASPRARLPYYTGLARLFTVCASQPATTKIKTFFSKTSHTRAMSPTTPTTPALSESMPINYILDVQAAHQGLLKCQNLPFHPTSTHSASASPVTSNSCACVRVFDVRYTTFDIHIVRLDNARRSPAAARADYIPRQIRHIRG